MSKLITVNFNNIKFEDYNAYVSSDFTLPGSELDVQCLEVPGRDGDVILSSNRYKSISWSLPVYFMGKYNESLSKAMQLRTLLTASPKFFNLKISKFPNWTFKAACVGPIDISHSTSDLTAEIPFNFMPYAYLESQKITVNANSPQIITNIGTLPSKPLCKITGSGPCTITCGNSVMKFTGLDNGLLVDSENESCTNLNGTKSMFSLMNSDFLEIGTGKQQISISNGTVEIEPRWVVRI